MRDRLRAGVVARGRKLVAQLEDRGLDARPHLMRARARSTRARLECRVAAGAVAGEQRIDPAARDVMTPGKLARAAALEHDRVHHVASQTHRDTPSLGWVSTMS